MTVKSKSLRAMVAHKYIQPEVLYSSGRVPVLELHGGLLRAGWSLTLDQRDGEVMIYAVNFKDCFEVVGEDVVDAVDQMFSAFATFSRLAPGHTRH